MHIPVDVYVSAVSVCATARHHISPSRRLMYSCATIYASHIYPRVLYTEKHTACTKHVPYSDVITSKLCTKFRGSVAGHGCIPPHIAKVGVETTTGNRWLMKVKRPLGLLVIWKLRLNCLRAFWAFFYIIMSRVYVFVDFTQKCRMNAVDDIFIFTIKKATRTQGPGKFQRCFRLLKNGERTTRKTGLVTFHREWYTGCSTN